jgi:lysophospholipase L1-like esterase
MPRLVKTTIGGSPRVLDLGARAGTNTVPDLRKIVCVGDSLVAGNQDGPGQNWPAILGTALGSGVTVINHGNAAWTSTELAIFQGGLDVTVAAATIPATITPVTLTVTAPTADLSPPANSAIHYRWVGTLAGVAGVLRRDAGTGAWTFTRLTPGSSTPVTAGAAFRAVNGTPYGDAQVVLMVGRNNFANVATVLGDVAAIVASLTTTTRRVLVCSVTTASTEVTGTQAHTQVKALNDALAATYGPNYLDVRRYLIDSGLSFSGLTPTGPDSTAVAGDSVPPQLCTDGLHWNRYGVRAAAKAITDKLAALGRTPDAVAAVPSAAANDATNLYWSPGFEHSSGINYYGFPSTMLAARTPDAARTGTWGLRTVFNQTAASPTWVFDVAASLAAAKSASVWVRPSKSAQLGTLLQGYNANNDLVANDTGPGQTVPANTWAKLTLPSTVTAAGVTSVWLVLTSTTTWNAGDYVDIEDIQIVAGSTAP